MRLSRVTVLGVALIAGIIAAFLALRMNGVAARAAGARHRSQGGYGPDPGSEQGPADGVDARRRRGAMARLAADRRLGQLHRPRGQSRGHDQGRRRPGAVDLLLRRADQRSEADPHRPGLHVGDPAGRQARRRHQDRRRHQRRRVHPAERPGRRDHDAGDGGDTGLERRCRPPRSSRPRPSCTMSAFSPSTRRSRTRMARRSSSARPPRWS